VSIAIITRSTGGSKNSFLQKPALPVAFFREMKNPVSALDFTLASEATLTEGMGL
jgi:hypothetical protein